MRKRRTRCLKKWDSNLTFASKPERVMKSQPKGWVCKDYLGVRRCRWMLSVTSKEISMSLMGVSKNKELISVCNCPGTFQTRS